MATVKLNQSIVGATACPEGRGKVEISDSVCKGLFLEVRKSGRQRFYLRYTNNRGRQHQYRIGDAGVISLTQARQPAQSSASTRPSRRISKSESIKARARKTTKIVLRIAAKTRQNMPTEMSGSRS